MNKLVFVTGGARSGKSIFAEKLALEIKRNHLSNKEIAYIATAENTDEEFEERIKKHQERRGSDFKTFEEPIELGVQFEKIFNEYNIFIIECLTTWLGNIYHTEPGRIDKEIFGNIGNILSLSTAKFDTSGDWEPDEHIKKLYKSGNELKLFDLLFKNDEKDKIVIIVSNEIGLGIVPDNEIVRAFRDDLGIINKRIAANADYVFNCVSGIPQRIK